MYSIMLQHSSNLINSLRKKVEADEVIEVKEWVISFSELRLGQEFFFSIKFSVLSSLLLAEYLVLTVWMLWPALPSVWTLILSTIPQILLWQTSRKWSSLTSWTPCLCLWVCHTLCSKTGWTSSPLEPWINHIFLNSYSFQSCFHSCGQLLRGWMCHFSRVTCWNSSTAF